MKKLISILLSIGILTSLFTGCGSTAGTVPEKITGFDVVLEAAYDYAGEFNEGFAKVGRLDENGNMKYYFINTKGEVISGEYDYAADFSDGMAVVGISHKFDEYSDGYMYGYIDTSGNEAIPLKFEGHGSEDMCYSFYDGLAVVQQLMQDDFYAVATYLIDKQGNKVGETELFEPGYGGYGMEDPRVLELEATYSDYDKYIGWSSVQEARIYGNFPVYAYGMESGKTIELNEKLETVSVTDGNLVNIWDGLKLIDYDFMRSWDKKALIDKDGNVIIDGVNSAYLFDDGLICVTKGDFEHLYSTDGSVVKENCISIGRRKDGYILEITPGEFRVVDKNFNTLWTAFGNNLMQSAGTANYVDGKYVYNYEPLFRLEFNMENSDGYPVTAYEYLDPVTGETVIPAYDGARYISHVSDDYYYINAVDRQNNNLPAIFFNIKNKTEYTLDGVYNVIFNGSTENGIKVNYRTTNEFTGDTLDGLLTADTDGFPLITPVDTSGETGPDIEEYRLLANDTYSIWGVEGEHEPVTLKKGEEVFGRFTATSLVYKNIRKDGRTVNWDAWEAGDFSIVDLDGTALTETYEGMGRISEGYISFCTGDKWGYLKAK